MPLFFYRIEICGAAFQGKYIDRIDKFFKCAFRFGYPLLSCCPLKERDLWEIEGITLFYLQSKQNILKDLLLIDVPSRARRCDLWGRQCDQILLSGD